MRQIEKIEKLTRSSYYIASALEWSMSPSFAQASDRTYANVEASRDSIEKARDLLNAILVADGHPGEYLGPVDRDW